MNLYAKTFMLLKSEIHHLVVILVPVVLALSFFNQMPKFLPMNLGFGGQQDFFVPRVVPFLVVFVLYAVIFLLVEITCGNGRARRYVLEWVNQLRFISTVLMSYYVIIVVLNAVGIEVHPSILIILLVFVLLILLGYYLRNAREHMLVTYKTPWTLHHEDIWVKTHHFASWTWMAGGVVGFCTSLAITDTDVLYPLVSAVAMGCLLAPYFYSWIKFRQMVKIKRRR